MAEVEAKFLIHRPEQFDQVLETLEKLGYTVTRGSTQELVDRYFDTPDWSILRTGWSYRRREQDGCQTLTLKAIGSGQDAVFVREEIEQTLPKALSGDLQTLPTGPVQSRLKKIVNDPQCQELFRIENHRTVFDVVAPNDDPARLKLSFDRAHINTKKVTKAAPGQLDFIELELELQTGKPEIVEQLASELRNQIRLVPAQLSKFRRGIQTAGLTTPDELSLATPSNLNANDPILKLVYCYLGRQLNALKLHMPWAWEGLDPEGVHQMRVAIRRFRSVLRFFRHMFHGDTMTKLNHELRWLARILGNARDADVCGEAIPGYREALSEKFSDAIGSYEQHLRDTTSEAYAALIEGLESERYVELVHQLENFINSGPPISVLRRFGSVRISDGADLYFKPLIEMMLKQGRSIKADSPADKLHELRIEAKRLRYLLEFLSEIESERWTKAVKATRRLQTILGDHQDAYTAQVRLQAYAQSVPLRVNAREILLAQGALIHLEEERAIKCREQFYSAWAQFEKTILALLNH